ncbi:3-isopropylmalate/(R)-2-methylmalate dehydratase small subunit [Devosia lucknowensis]|uniref:3-isopropylmalate dehydratase n=1 Tax=Devosia lucknowensis TaxID=1096929 RepID=A0A1Y6FL98_9HYPH|nr:3-isopropylmalate dehydratase small subunit [Devosia lucknowensis]SMQ75605.1 3-isopropylmalate/(R)-2-methylmalate dehydratase small subunit [Devosia lucknowensis]
MEKFVTLTSVAAPLPEADVDTDIIFPARFLLLLDKIGLGKHLFHERRHRPDGTSTDFVLNIAPFNAAKILVADANFGSGSSREQAVWALADFGIRCVIAPSFGEIFYSNCFKNGVLPIVITGEAHANALLAAGSGEPFTIDLERQLVILPNGPSLYFEIDPYRKKALMLGLDEIGGILAEDANDIAAFEKRLRASQPWLFLDDGRLDTLFSQTDKA